MHWPRAWQPAHTAARPYAASSLSVVDEMITGPFGMSASLLTSNPALPEVGRELATSAGLAPVLTSAKLIVSTQKTLLDTKAVSAAERTVHYGPFDPLLPRSR